MRSIFRFTLLPLFAASTLMAETLMTIAPTSGPTSGGTEVTITGDFGSGPYTVLFGFDVPATSTRRVDERTLVAVTPAHTTPGFTTLFISDSGPYSGIDTDLTFGFMDATPAAYERILLPVFTGPVRGAFGTVFHTELIVANHGSATVTLFGMTPACPNFLCIPVREDSPFDLEAGQQVDPSWEINFTGTPGRFLYVPKDQLDSLSMNLRVHDVTRAALNYGTEIPIVREREFVNDRIVFVGVPADPRFRNTLRIYGMFPFTALVKVGDREPVRVRLQGATDVFDPAYGVFSAFPPDSGPVRVTIDVELDACGSSYDCGFPPIVPVHVPIWAFITVTNNETQVISTISPQP